MSEYQFIHFMAIDKSLDAKQIEYMGTQSSRAEITKWEFTNEYHYGDFRGNVKEMMRRGYDVHLHFTNFGIRRLMMRLPHGLPWDQKTFKQYLPEYGVTWHADKSGPGGVLEIEPENDAGTFNYFMEVEELLEQVAPMRELIISGDLRPLYVFWLAMTRVCGDEEAMEPPVPAGMGELPDCLLALAAFYELGEDLLQSAAKESPPMPDVIELNSQVATWVTRQSKNELAELVERFLVEDAEGVRTETLALIRGEQGVATWPTAEPTRTFQQLSELAEDLSTRRKQRKATADAKARAKFLSAMAANPQAVIDEVDVLARQRSKSGYETVAQKLIDLREALGPTNGPARVIEIAQKLRETHPTLRALASELKKHGLLKK